MVHRNRHQVMPRCKCIGPALSALCVQRSAVARLRCLVFIRVLAQKRACLSPLKKTNLFIDILSNNTTYL